MKRMETAKIILGGLLMVGGVAVAATFPGLVAVLAPFTPRNEWKKIKRPQYKKRTYDMFYRLWKSGDIEIDRSGRQIYIHLTGQGKRKAGKYQINDLKIKAPKKWDGKWRILIFDIADKRKVRREALRGKIKELGMFQIQKSVWVHPYDFTKEVGILAEFFAFSDQELKVIVAEKISGDGILRKYFNLK